MISTRRFGRCFAFGSILAVLFTFNDAAHAQRKKKGDAAAEKSAKKKKKPVVDEEDEEEEEEDDVKPAKKPKKAAKPKPEPKEEVEAKPAAKKGGKKKKEAAKVEARPVVVMAFKGPSGKKVQGYVVKALDDLDTVGDIKEIDSERENSADAAVAVAKEEQAAAVVYGTVVKKGQAHTLELTVRNGGDGRVLGESTLKGAGVPKLKTKIEEQVAVELAESFAGAQVPAAEAEEAEPAEVAEKEPEEEPEEEAKPEEEPEEEPAADTKGRPSPLEIGLGLRGFIRNLSYNDDLHDTFPNIFAQNTYNGPGISGFLNLRWYPLAHSQGGPLSHLGLTGGYERGFATKAKTPDDQEVDVTHQEFFVGLRGRIPVARHELGLTGTFGQHEFTIEDDALFLPDVKYSYLRFGFDGRFRSGSLLFGFSTGYRAVLSAGEITEDAWFPHASVGGIDFGLLGGYELSKSFDFLVGLDMRRYFFTLNSEPGDAVVTRPNGGTAGGALDHYWSAWLGVAWRLPGKEN